MTATTSVTRPTQVAAGYTLEGEFFFLARYGTEVVYTIGEHEEGEGFDTREEAITYLDKLADEFRTTVEC